MKRSEILQELIKLRTNLDHFKTEATKPVVLTQDMAITSAQYLLDNLITDICNSIEAELKAKGKIQ